MISSKEISDIAKRVHQRTSPVVKKASAQEFAPKPEYPGMVARNPIVDATFTIWHDPSAYDPIKHGPPYLPNSGSLVMAKQAGMVKQTSPQEGVFDAAEVLKAALPGIAVALQGLALIHQSHHWLTKGPTFYADHLLFERVYTPIPKEIDQISERAVGLQGAEAVGLLLSPSSLAMGAAVMTLALTGRSDEAEVHADPPEAFPGLSLRAEETFLELLQKLSDKLADARKKTPGLNKVLEDIASQHEESVYVLRQRVGV